MTTMDHILTLSSTGKRTSGTRKELFTGACSSCRWSHPQSTRAVIREAFEEHFDKITEGRNHETVQ